MEADVKKFTYDFSYDSTVRLPGSDPAAASHPPIPPQDAASRSFTTQATVYQDLGTVRRRSRAPLEAGWA